MKYSARNRYLIGCMALLIMSCQQERKSAFQTDPEVYWGLINDTIRDPLEETDSMIRFWSARLQADSSSVGELGPLGAAYEARFALRGDLSDLLSARRLFEIGARISAHHSDQFIRNQARVDISLHRFDRAYRSLDSLMEARSNKQQTRLQLFDAAMELEKLEQAEALLIALEDTSDFNYLIRAAKWNDHRGDLDTAIRYMEQARALAEAKKSKPLMEWVYSNLATYYGHAGRLSDSYSLLLKTLELNPRHVQSIKSLAWMEYAAMKDPEAANKLYDYISMEYKGLDLLLRKAEVLEYTDQLEAAEALREHFVKEVLRLGLSRLYANDLIQLRYENDGVQTFAWQQYVERPTQMQAALAAYALQQAPYSDSTGAGELIELHDLSFAHEPVARYYALKTLRAMGAKLDPTALAQLKEAHYELGPLKAAEVAQWH